MEEGRSLAVSLEGAQKSGAENFNMSGGLECNHLLNCIYPGKEVVGYEAEDRY